MKIGVMFGNPETTPGGRALKFYSSVRIDIRRISAIKEGDVITGNHVRAKVVKNKVAAPFRQAEFDIMFDGGISREADLLDLALANGVVVKSGAWFSYGDVRLGQGRENSKVFLRDNPDLFEEIRKAILAKRDSVEANKIQAASKRLDTQTPATKSTPASSPAKKRKRA